MYRVYLYMEIRRSLFPGTTVVYFKGYVVFEYISCVSTLCFNQIMLEELLSLLLNWDLTTFSALSSDSYNGQICSLLCLCGKLDIHHHILSLKACETTICLLRGPIEKIIKIKLFLEE